MRRMRTSISTSTSALRPFRKQVPVVETERVFSSSNDVRDYLVARAARRFVRTRLPCLVTAFVTSAASNN